MRGNRHGNRERGKMRFTGFLLMILTLLRFSCVCAYYYENGRRVEVASREKGSRRKKRGFLIRAF